MDIKVGFWSLERLQIAKSEFESGTSFKDIAKILGNGCTRNMVAGKLSRIAQQKAKVEAITKEAKITPPISQLEKETTQRVERVNQRDIAHSKKNSRAAQMKPLDPSARLEDLKSSQCHFPYGDNKPYSFCGRPIMDKHNPYCASHHKLTHQPFKHSGDY